MAEQGVHAQEKDNQEQPSEDDIVRILVCTDTHVGYLERDPIRGNDSFVTWEEILKHAKEMKVDFILHGGDLFHDNKPSRRTLYKTMEAVRKYCFGDDVVKIRIVSDQEKNFPNFKTVNFEDPNFNVAVPIFVIHGNHDDPSGDGQYSAIDLLSIANQVNYFGKSNNIDDITVYPILMKKGKTQIAIYGLGNIRDERLYRTFHQKKVKLMRPVESREDWFNIMVLHQNRIAHSPKNYIHESMLDSFLNLIVWGHEHECLIKPTPSSEAEFWVTQPGSSIATSLSEFEAKPKHIGLLEICGNQFRMNPIPLSTVRPYVIEEVILSSEPDLKQNDIDGLREFLAKKVEEMIVKANQLQESATKVIPLIRLKVEYTGFTTINPSRFGQPFVGRVANPDDILNFYRKKKKTTVVAKQDETEAEKALFDKAMRPDPLDNSRIEDLITSFLDQQQLQGGGVGGIQLLEENEFNVALKLFVEKTDSAAFQDFVNKQLSKTQKYLAALEPMKTVSADDIQNMVIAQKVKQQQTSMIQREAASKTAADLAKIGVTTDADDDKIGDDMMDVDTAVPISTKSSKKTKIKEPEDKQESDEEENHNDLDHDKQDGDLLDEDDVSEFAKPRSVSKKGKKAQHKPSTGTKKAPTKGKQGGDEDEDQGSKSKKRARTGSLDAYIKAPPQKKAKKTTIIDDDDQGKSQISTLSDSTGSGLAKSSQTTPSKATTTSLKQSIQKTPSIIIDDDDVVVKDEPKQLSSTSSSSTQKKTQKKKADSDTSSQSTNITPASKTNTKPKATSVPAKKSTNLASGFLNDISADENGDVPGDEGGTDSSAIESQFSVKKWGARKKSF